MSIISKSSVISKPELTFPIFGYPFEFLMEEAKIYVNKTCTLKIKLPFAMDEYFPQYNMHFVLSPRKYRDAIDEIARKLDSKQMEINIDPKELTEDMMHTAEDYKNHSELLWMVSFRNVSLLEYKKDTQGNTLLTFTLPISLLKFILSDERSNIWIFIVLNDSNDKHYMDLSEEEKKEMFEKTRFNEIDKDILYA